MSRGLGRRGAGTYSATAAAAAPGAQLAQHASAVTAVLLIVTNSCKLPVRISQLL